MYSNTTIDYAIFKTLGRTNKSILIDLSNIPTEGMALRISETNRLYKHYTDLGYTVFIVTNAQYSDFLCAPSERVYENTSKNNTINSECSYAAAIYDKLNIGELHVVCTKHTALQKQFSYLQFGIRANIHALENNTDEVTNTGYYFKSGSTISYIT